MGRNPVGQEIIYFQKHWPVEIREEGIIVEMEDGGGFFELFR